MTNATRRTVRFTRPMLEYLQELVRDDLATTELTADERGQARAALRRISTAIRGWDDGYQAPTHKDLMPYLLVPYEMATSADWRVAYQRKQSEERHDQNLSG